jgi:hypothetical protein
MSESELNAHAAEGDGMNAVLERVTGDLRSPVEASPDFVARVMTGVRAAADNQRQLVVTTWWRRRSVRLSPAAALALAAGIAVVAFLGARAGEDGTAAQYVVAQPASTEVVRFVFVDRAAEEVSVVGSFNQWQKGATPLRATGVPGVWAVSVALKPGIHEYAFVIDGERWMPDPFAPAKSDEFGTESSIVRVQAQHSS